MNGETRQPITDYRDFEVWNESMSLAAEIYELARPFLREEMVGMTSQMRRAPVSVHLLFTIHAQTAEAGR